MRIQKPKCDENTLEFHSYFIIFQITSIYVKKELTIILITFWFKKIAQKKQVNKFLSVWKTTKQNSQINFTISTVFSEVRINISFLYFCTT